MKSRHDKKIDSPALTGSQQPHPVAPLPGGVWVLDFALIQNSSSAPTWTMMVIDYASRAILAVDASMSHPSDRAIEFLARLMTQYGRPLAIRCDMSEWLMTARFQARCRSMGIALQPAAPHMKAVVERTLQTARRMKFVEPVPEAIDKVRRAHKSS